MEQRDYLKDQIDALAKALGKLLAQALHLKNEKRIAESMELINTSLEKELEIDMSRMEKMTETEFTDHLKTQGKWGAIHHENLGDLFMELADSKRLLYPEKHPEALLRKALIGYQLAKAGQLNYSYELHTKITHLQNSLSKERN